MAGKYCSNCGVRLSKDIKQRIIDLRTKLCANEEKMGGYVFIGKEELGDLTACCSNDYPTQRMLFGVLEGKQKSFKYYGFYFVLISVDSFFAYGNDIKDIIGG